METGRGGAGRMVRIDRDERLSLRKRAFTKRGSDQG